MNDLPLKFDLRYAMLMLRRFFIQKINHGNSYERRSILLKYGKSFSDGCTVRYHLTQMWNICSLADVLFVTILLKYGTFFTDGCTVHYRLTEVWNICSLTDVLSVSILLKYGTSFSDGCTVCYHRIEI
jgi:hypothetical protein